MRVHGPAGRLQCVRVQRRWAPMTPPRHPVGPPQPHPRVTADDDAYTPSRRPPPVFIGGNFNQLLTHCSKGKDKEQSAEFHRLFDGLHTLLHNRDVPKLRQFERDYWGFNPKQCPKNERAAFDLWTVLDAAAKTAFEARMAARTAPGCARRSLRAKVTSAINVLTKSMVSAAEAAYRLMYSETGEDKWDATQAMKVGFKKHSQVSATAKMRKRKDPEVVLLTKEERFMFHLLDLLDDAGYALATNEEILYARLHRSGYQLKVDWGWLDSGLLHRAKPYAGRSDAEPPQLFGRVLVAVRDRGEARQSGFFLGLKWDAMVQSVADRAFVRPLVVKFPRLAATFFPGLQWRKKQIDREEDDKYKHQQCVAVSGSSTGCNGLYFLTSVRFGRPVWRRERQYDSLEPVRELFALPSGHWMIGSDCSLSKGWVASDTAAATPTEVGKWLELTEWPWEEADELKVSEVVGVASVRTPVCKKTARHVHKEWSEDILRTGESLKAASWLSKVELVEPTRRNHLLVFRRKRPWQLSQLAGQGLWRAGGATWNPYNIEINLYRDVPLVDLDALMPEIDARNKPLDWLSQIGIAGVIAFNLGLFYNETLGNAAAALLGVAAANLVRLYGTVQNSKLRQVNMANTLVQRNMAATGVHALRALVNTATQQRLKQALLLFHVLSKGGPSSRTWNAAELERQIWDVLEDARESGLTVGDPRLPPGRLADMATTGALRKLGLWEVDPEGLDTDELGLVAVDQRTALLRIRTLLTEDLQ
eukprot:TRINITY_DN30414_c0_g1_i1.p1 TRINITY_DN30414_c0_g1~~TRINITY_DN30414_c0_g1_i1.p1  ORF type:complete len:778 (+),score=252.48 TRINITY_DN30414_c0_g1_i1:54-2336(+)